MSTQEQNIYISLEGVTISIDFGSDRLNAEGWEIIRRNVKHLEEGTLGSITDASLTLAHQIEQRINRIAAEADQLLELIPRIVAAAEKAKDLRARMKAGLQRHES